MIWWFVRRFFLGGGRSVDNKKTMRCWSRQDNDRQKMSWNLSAKRYIYFRYVLLTRNFFISVFVNILCYRLLLTLLLVYWAMLWHWLLCCMLCHSLAFRWHPLILFLLYYWCDVFCGYCLLLLSGYCDGYYCLFIY